MATGCWLSESHLYKPILESGPSSTQDMTQDCCHGCVEGPGCVQACGNKLALAAPPAPPCWGGLPGGLCAWRLFTCLQLEWIELVKEPQRLDALIPPQLFIFSQGLSFKYFFYRVRLGEDRNFQWSFSVLFLCADTWVFCLEKAARDMKVWIHIFW